MKLITLFVGERLDHVVLFDGSNPETETYIIEKDCTQLFAFYHAVTHSSSTWKVDKEIVDNSIILQTDEGQTCAYIQKIAASTPTSSTNPDYNLNINVVLTTTELQSIKLDGLDDANLKFSREDANLWPLKLSANDKDKPFMINVHFTLEDTGHRFERDLNLCVAPDECIYDIVLDFGSEASQMGVFRRDLNQTQQDIQKLFPQMKGVLKERQPINPSASTHASSSESSTPTPLATSDIPADQATNVIPADQAAKDSPADQATSDVPASNPQNDSEDKEYLQRDEDEHLFKSVFYVSENADHLHMLTTYNEAKDLISRNYIQVPNVKITQFGGTILPEIRGGADLFDTYASLYRASINEFIFNALKGRKENDCVNLHVLMPNVYSPVDIAGRLQQLRKDVNDIIKSENLKVKAVELSALSESDASILGAFEVIETYTNKKNDGGLFIILDAGKGTLDFSALRFEWPLYGRLRAQSIYRDGIIGAGNSLTYAYLYALLYDYFISLENKPSNDDLRKYVFDNILGCTSDGISKGGGDLSLILDLMKAIENYKMAIGNHFTPDKAINPLPNKATEQNILNVKIEAFTAFVKNMVKGSTYKPLSEDAQFFVTQTINQLVEKVCDANKGLGCLKLFSDFKPAKGVIFAGRAFCLPQFKEAMKKKLEADGIVEEDAEQEYLSKNNTWSISQKNVCLYVRNAIQSGIYNSRMSSMPWVKREKRVTNASQEKGSKGNWFLQHTPKWAIKLFTKSDDEQENTSFSINDIINTRDSNSTFQTPGSVDGNWLVAGCELNIDPQTDTLIVGSTKYSGKHLQGKIEVFFTGEKIFKYRYFNGKEHNTAELKDNGLNISTSFFFFGTQFPNVKPKKESDVTLPYDPNNIAQTTDTPSTTSSLNLPSNGRTQQPDKKEDGSKAQPDNANNNNRSNDPLLDEMNEMGNKI